MTQRHAQEYGNALIKSLHRITRNTSGDALPDPQLATFIETTAPEAGKLRKMKKFRFQLLHQWLIYHFYPCRVADIGGGKGLLAFLLRQSGWDVTIIDPVTQALPVKYKDIAYGKRVHIDPDTKVAYLPLAFDPSMGQHYDLLVAMHAHGCNAAIIDAAVEFGCGFVIFPCCVIDEPFYPPIGVQWLESLADYAVRQGLSVYPFRLNFKGQNIGLCCLGRCLLKRMQ
ncbi:MAG: hypothetical protein JW726_10620 [Anaerolineales bacterium]|nr:hypothetical protein [Anaerolineales bacterium]